MTSLHTGERDPDAPTRPASAIRAKDLLESARLSVLAGCDEIALAALEIEGALHPDDKSGDREVAAALRECAGTVSEIAALLRMTGELLKAGRR